jgi:hypothetical protein
MTHLGNEYDKKAGAIKDYKINWALWLTSDTIVTSEWTVPTGIVKDSDSHNNVLCTIWLSGGTKGTNYILTNTITTAGLRTEMQDIIINCV